jgi:hypothetical protein
MSNGGLIGNKNNIPTLARTSGVWGLREQFRAERDGIWLTSATSSFIDAYGINGSSTTYNFTTASISPSLVVIAVHSETLAASSVPASGVTIGGVTATQAVSVTSTGSSGGVAHVSLWYAKLSSSTTSVTVDYSSAASLRCGIGVYTIQNYKSITPVFTGSDTDSNFVTTRTINTTSINQGSVIIAAHTSGNIYAHTWSGVTEKYDEQIAGGLTGMTGASLDTDLTQSHTIVSTTDTTPSQGTALGVAVWR